ncbi:MAG: tetratricopeptide repeat protein [Fimbriimonadaceae bacterium]|nr:tetratricopeptide repeat protein [Fimbriimonadaceae bacterium]
MEKGTRFQRGMVHIQHERWDDAEREFRGALADDPADAPSKAMLAYVLSIRGQHPEAILEARGAIAQAPDFAYAHYMYALVLLQAGKNKEAQRAIGAALKLDPSDDDNWALAASIDAQLGRWKKALQACDSALEINPENKEALNLRGLAQSYVGQKAEGASSLRESLRLDPQDSLTHVLLGDSHLKAGRLDEAVASYREALRLDPDSEEARVGLLDSLRARYWPYRAILTFRNWITRFPSNARWGITVGLYFLAKLARSAANTRPDLAPFLLPPAIAYLGFVYLSWCGATVFNVFLLPHPVGRLALSRIERLSARIVATLWVAGLATASFAWATSSSVPFLPLMFAAFGTLLVGLASHLQSLKAQKWLSLTLGLGLLAAILLYAASTVSQLLGNSAD